jgi:hypothetical protein
MGYNKNHYHAYTTKKYEDEKKTDRFAVVGLLLGIFIGILSSSVSIGIVAGLIGFFAGGIFGWIITLFD